MGIGIIYTRVNIGGYIIMVPYLELLVALLSNSLHVLIYFSYFATLPEDAASKASLIHYY